LADKDDDDKITPGLLLHLRSSIRYLRPRAKEDGTGSNNSACTAAAAVSPPLRILEPGKPPTPKFVAADTITSAVMNDVVLLVITVVLLLVLLLLLLRECRMNLFPRRRRSRRVEDQVVRAWQILTREWSEGVKSPLAVWCQLPYSRNVNWAELKMST
jgi:hypothetical protein